MRIRTGFLIVGLSLLFINILSCSEKPDFSGLYVHYRGTLKYYTMTVENSGSGRLKVILEGVPLDNYKTTRWAYPCTGSLSGETLKCGNCKIVFHTGDGLATVNYSGDEKQIFVNNKLDIEEEIKHYDEKRE